jgi:hypothetical protein
MAILIMLLNTLRQYLKNDQRRLWMVSNKFWVSYEQFEYTRLNKVRELMDNHMTYDKEEMLKKDGDEESKDEKFVWSYVLRPVRKGFK